MSKFSDCIGIWSLQQYTSYEFVNHYKKKFYWGETSELQASQSYDEILRSYIMHVKESSQPNSLSY
jgi:hypothetical protein